VALRLERSTPKAAVIIFNKTAGIAWALVPRRDRLRGGCA
jgi:hypothetical protein